MLIRRASTRSQAQKLPAPSSGNLGAARTLELRRGLWEVVSNVEARVGLSGDVSESDEYLSPVLPMLLEVDSESLVVQCAAWGTDGWVWARPVVVESGLE